MSWDEEVLVSELYIVSFIIALIIMGGGGVFMFLAQRAYAKRIRREDGLARSWDIFSYNRSERKMFWGGVAIIMIGFFVYSIGRRMFL